eukprot:Clim_evm6s204 gene=Clim_evmTU6s204
MATLRRRARQAGYEDFLHAINEHGPVFLDTQPSNGYEASRIGKLTPKVSQAGLMDTLRKEERKKETEEVLSGIVRPKNLTLGRKIQVEQWMKAEYVHVDALSSGTSKRRDAGPETTLYGSGPTSNIQKPGKRSVPDLEHKPEIHLN